MTKKRWITSEMDCCPECGDTIEIYTDCNVAYRFYDGDDVQCVVGCGPVGSFSVNEDDTGYVNWDGY